MAKKVESSKQPSDTFIMSALWNTFIFLRYYFDILLDKTFGFFMNSKRIPIGKPANLLVLESATSLARKIRKREITSEEVVQAFIERIKQVNPVLNSIVDNRFEKALQEARRIDKDIATGHYLDVDFNEKVFLGIPFTSKESTACEGLSWTFGLKKRVGKKAPFDAECIALMKNAGAICLGVSNLPQLNLWQETSNPVYGITNNPYNTTRNVGGSCGGESSILAACGSPLGIGTDIGGSCRIPAFMCGVFGHKTTSHLISTKGLTFRNGTENQTMVAVGPMTRYADDLKPFLKVLVGESAQKLQLDAPVNVQKLKYYYISDPQDPFVSPFRPEMKTTFANAVNHFKEISSQEPEELNITGFKYTSKLWRYWMQQESNDNFFNDINNREGEVNGFLEVFKHFTVGGEFTTAVIFNIINKYFPKVDDKWAREETDKLKKELLAKLDDNSVLLYPSAPFPASYHHTAFLRPYNFNLFSIWNVVKFPVTQVPMGLSQEGLPIGIQVVAAPQQDRLCLAVAKELETRFGGYVPPFEVK